MSRYSSLPLCKNCQARPVHVDRGRVHDFCGRTCASSYYSPTLDGGQPTQSETCLLCGSWEKAWVNGKLSDFCSKKCRDMVFTSSPLLLEIPATNDEFRDVSSLFRAAWKHPPAADKPIPGSVVKMYKIYSRESHMKRFRAYKEQVGNPRRRWHGTTRKCRLGDDATRTRFCSDQYCGMCGILQSSFQLSKAHPAGTQSYQRFGQGIYTSATSSKAYDYIRNEGGSPYLTMILSEVIMGKECKLPQEDHTLKKPPAGYNSVVGEPGLTVNYDEAIVYTNDAIRPEYLVVFEPGS
ncbi:PARP catalytic domain-containing protein [Phanerochaete sordida]|uniref:PARP catalytic domain-containing protein n=1 Tax=Phanerochaete sordida TaxID=48140 RepID=A0A9P3GHM6_9APHY|nr:PARP catalytic domain-containing protein [Phanerochaete sordida]